MVVVLLLFRCWVEAVVWLCGVEQRVFGLVSCPVMPEKARYVDSPC
jgi:hypothetical protein